ncbi:hypothetical protein PGB28_08665 [Primorskyibacter aestuariivivens]|uniref:hypothetical protein n=1 Tax=Primorskyibacter aestuariivivens TaxID=1888912 RepID=UPI0023003AC5|nr:hypothetical protein [Primorskyibacter aestuariivivens]MDA7428531.1 hypothetical protein [Primorskyibacter aestuariivivens]
MTKSWHIARDDDRLTLSRHPAPRFDLSAEASFPQLRRLALAQMVRQDLWRRLRNLRGFSPVVEVTRTETGLRLRAGGAVAGRFPRSHAEAQIASLLHDPAYRARWQSCARLTQGKDLL